MLHLLTLNKNKRGMWKYEKIIYIFSSYVYDNVLGF